MATTQDLMTALAGHARQQGTVQLADMQEGSIVLVRGGFGTEAAKRAIVTELDADIKNGRAGIGYTEEATGEERWAYLTQVQRVIKY